MSVILDESCFATLEYAKNMFLTESNYDYNIHFLESIGYLIGSWFGSLDYPPMKMWEISSVGRKALKDYKLKNLIASTSQCATGMCKGEYGSEVYIKTDCVVCGRQIVRGEIR